MSKFEVDDVVVNENGVPIWRGFDEISKNKAISLFKKGELVYAVDDEGHESLAQDESYFEDYNTFVIEK